MASWRVFSPETYLVATPRRHAPTVVQAAVKGKTVLVTGASSGIGRAASSKIARAGGRVVVVARSRDKLAELQSEIETGGGECLVLPTDLSQTKECEQLVEAVRAECGHVDVLVNNAGVSFRRSIAESTDCIEDFERAMGLNFFGAVAITIGLLPSMRDHGGHVINVSSLGVRTGAPNFAAYVASKAALDSFARSLALESTTLGLAVTTINMGLVRTAMIAPTKAYENFPAATAEGAADNVIDAIVRRPLRISPAAGTILEVAQALSPRVVQKLFDSLHDRAHDLAARRGRSGD